MNALNEMFWASLKDSFRSEHTLPNFKSEMNDIKFPDSDPSAANNYSWFFIFPFLNFSFLFWGWRSTHCFGSHLWAEWRKRDCILHPFKRYKKTFILETSILFGTLSQSTIVTYCQCIFYVSIAERCYVKVIKFINITLFTAFHQGKKKKTQQKSKEIVGSPPVWCPRSLHAYSLLPNQHEARDHRSGGLPLQVPAY